MALPEHLRKGMRGEQLTARKLRERGDRILVSGFRTQLGETDIVSLTSKDVLCFTEVKTRSPGGMFPPSDAVDKEKQARLVNNAAAFLKTAKTLEYTSVRFDIAEVVLYDMYRADINIIEDAFGQEYFPGKTKDRER